MVLGVLIYIIYYKKNSRIYCTISILYNPLGYMILYNL